MSRLIQRYEGLNHIFESRTTDPSVTIGPGPNQTLNINGGNVINEVTNNVTNLNISGIETFNGTDLIYVQGGSNFTLLQPKISGPSGSLLGSVAISQNGLILALGAPQASSNGLVYIYTRSAIGNAFTLQQTITSSSQINFGYSVALSSNGSVLAIAAPLATGENGSVYVYTTTNYTTWTQSTILIPTNPIDGPEMGYGLDISPDGTMIVAGGPYDGNNSTGAMWVFTNVAGVWSTSSKIQPTRLTGNSNIFGYSVQISSINYVNVNGVKNTQNIIAASAYGDNNNKGSVFIFTLVNGVWTQTQKINTTTNIGNSEFGSSLSLSYDGNTLVIGAETDNSSKGAFYICTKNSSQSTFGPITEYIPTGLSSGAEIGSSVALDRTNVNGLAVGAAGTNSFVGAVVTYLNASGLVSGVWTQSQTIVGTGYTANPQMGISTAMDQYGTLVFGGNQDGLTNQGAAWVYTSFGTLNVVGNVNIEGSLTVGSETITNLTTTNLTATNATISNATVTNETVTNLVVSGPVTLLTNPDPVIKTLGNTNYTLLQPKLTGAASSEFGTTCLSQNGLVLAVGATDYNSLIGAIYVYKRSDLSGSFTLSQTLTVTPTAGPGNFGQSVGVSYDGTTIIGGAPADNGNIGGTYVFFNSSYSNGAIPTGSWSQQAFLVGTGYTGSPEQGWQCDISQDGNTLVTGAPYDGVGATGAAWVFTRSGTTWTQQQKLTPSSFTGGNNHAGFAVSLSVGGSVPILTIGGYGDNSNRGAVWIFTYSGGTWTQTQKLTDNGLNTGAGWFGVYTMTSYDGNVLIVGASHDNSSTGGFYAFSKSSLQTTYSGQTLYKGASTSNLTGASVGLDRVNYLTLIVGSPGYSAGANIGKVDIYTNGGAGPANWTSATSLSPTGYSGTPIAGSFCTMDQYQTAAFGGISDNSSHGAAWVYSSFGPLVLDANVTVSGNETVDGTMAISGNTTVGGSLGVDGSLFLGSPLGAAYGGTGVNNGSNTLTVSGNSTINQNVSTTATPLFGGLNISNTITSQYFNTISGSFSVSTTGTYQIVIGHGWIGKVSTYIAQIPSGIWGSSADVIMPYNNNVTCVVANVATYQYAGNQIAASLQASGTPGNMQVGITTLAQASTLYWSALFYMQFD